MKLGLAVLAMITCASGRKALAGAQPPDLRPLAVDRAARSVWDGVYTPAQARRGALKSGLCTSCHGDGFVGGPAPELTGREFLASWNGRSVGDLFDLIRLTMPDDDPGSLSRPVYADLVAYILALNKYPAGTDEIGTDPSLLKLIRIEPKE
jgi:hypothetical protein